MAATDNPAIIAPVNGTDNVAFLPYNDEEALKEYFQKYGRDIAAVIVEAIQGVGGIAIANESFLQTIRQLCNENGALFIADEVQCGYGRTGKFFCLDHANVDADIYTMAKGMGNGFPVGGILIAPHIQPKHGMLGTTFGGNHLACAASLAVLEIIEQDSLLEKAKGHGQYLMNELKNFDGLKNIRGKGLMIGFDVSGELKELRKYLLQTHHVFTGEAKPNVIRLLPALSISLKQLNEFLEKMKEAIQQVSNGVLKEHFGTIK